MYRTMREAEEDEEWCEQVYKLIKNTEEGERERGREYMYIIVYRELVRLRGWTTKSDLHPGVHTLVIRHSMNTSTDFQKKKKSQTSIVIDRTT